ncbi:tRNAHis guanylyltransferase-domain-containing protein [Obelidium mucronatum]|nr:tRNAHis guanylyltransferase-domain-containing protein [Obelidium mucronatum]
MTENKNKEPSILTLLKSAPLVTLPPHAAHSSWPDIRRPTWSALGDKLTAQEQLVTRLLPSNQWISLRLDLKGFSSQSKRLFPSRKYSPLFATAMHNTLLALMTETQAHYGFTQSDEITLLLPPHYNQQRQTWNPHPFNGKRDKLVSLTASFASVVLMQQFMKLGVPLPFQQLEKDAESSGKDSSLKPTVQFDARAASWDSLQDAFELILWRAQDCTVNGLSDAVCKSDLPEKRALTELNSWQKVKVLHENGLLPLEEHQAHGVFIERQVKSVEAVDLSTGLNVVVERGVLVHIPGSVLVNVMSGLIHLDT